MLAGAATVTLVFCLLEPKAYVPRTAAEIFVEAAGVFDVALNRPCWHKPLYLSISRNSALTLRALVVTSRLDLIRSVEPVVPIR